MYFGNPLGSREASKPRNVFITSRRFETFVFEFCSTLGNWQSLQIFTAKNRGTYV